VGESKSVLANLPPALRPKPLKNGAIPNDAKQAV
jgi:hypothetical protein